MNNPSRPLTDAEWELIADVQESYRMAMRVEGVSKAQIASIDATVEDYLTNHYGDD